ncbi:MAG: C25 family cysteine peptidase, partial [Armatimonadota bacterium]
VGFHFHSDSYICGYEGAYVDNVLLTGIREVPNSNLHTYDNYMDAYMVRKYVIDASGWGSATLSYWAWYQTESSYDYLQVIVTNDAGAHWYYIGDRLSGTSGWAYHSLDIPSTYFTSQFGIGYMFHSDSSIHGYEGAYLDDINLYAEINHPPVVSDGYVTPTSGYPDTIFTFRVKYTDSDGDPADTKRLILDDDGIFYFDMYHVSGNPIDGEWFEVQVTGLHPDSQVGEHRFFFYFTDGRGGEDYDPDDGWHSGPIVNEGEVYPDIRLQYDSLLFEYPESSGYPTVDVSEVEGNDVFVYRVNCTVDFGGLFLETDGNYTVVSSPGCDRIFETGRPILPAKTFYILLPPSTQVTSSKVVLCDKVDLRDEYFVQIAPSPHILGGCPSDVSTDDLPGPYPEQIVRINGIHGFRGYRLLSVTFFAAQYYPSLHKLFKINKLGMELELRKVDEQDIESLFRGLPEDENAVKSMVVNPDAASLYSDIRSMEITTTYKYIIITSSSLVDAFQPLADWKTQKVGSATIVTVSSITSSYSGRDTQEKIRNFIIDKYTNWGTEW